MNVREKWWTPFEARGRTGQIAVQHAGGEGCPTPSIEPCPCRQDLNYHLLAHDWPLRDVVERASRDAALEAEVPR